MHKITTFADIARKVAASGKTPVIAVVNPADSCTLEAVAMGLSNGIARFLLIGTQETINSIPSEIKDNPAVQLRLAENPDSLADEGVAAVNEGNADVLMKGLISTDSYLRAVLNKEHGLLPKGNVLTHLSVAELPGYHKLLFFSDVAVIPYPTLEQRVAMIRYDVATCRALGIERPNIALIHFTEKVNPKFPNSTDYVKLIEMAESGEFGPVSMGGPMDVKTACDLHSAQVKGIKSEVCGNTDLLIFPNIESGNTFYKTITLFAGASVAGMLQGARCPVILPSRSDAALSKYHSMLLASAAAGE